MKIIVISRPDFFEGEAVQINALFAGGMQLLHLRKPDCSKEELASLLRDIHSVNYPLIALHQHHELAGEFGIKRLHFPEQLRSAQSEASLQNLRAQGFVLSTSIHDAAALDSLSDAFSYTFFGPVFDSFSKPGYLTKLPPDFKLNKQTFPGEVIALGGIDESRIQTILRMGFQGAALLSSIWQNPHQKNLNLIPGLKPGAMDFFSGANEFAAGNFAKGENSKVSCPGFQAGDRIRKEQFDDIQFSEKINQNRFWSK